MVCYTAFLRLPYFDPIRFHVVDPMHNLLLGTAKDMMDVWVDQGIISKQILQSIQGKIEHIRTPVDVGKIPSKISASFAGFKTDQWHNWTLLFSVICLKSLAGVEHL